MGRVHRGGRPPAPDAWDGYASLVVAEACIASIRSGKPEAVSVREKPGLYGTKRPG